MHKHRALAASHWAAGNITAAAPTSTTPGHETVRLKIKEDSLGGIILGLQHPNFLGSYTLKKTNKKTSSYII